MSDQVQFGADATEYFDVINRMQAKLDELAKKTDHTGSRAKVAGDSFSIFGERRAALHLGEIAGDLVKGGNAADVFTNSVYRAEYALGKAFLPLLITSAAVNFVQRLDEAQKKYLAFEEAVHNAGTQSSLSGDFLSTDQISKNLDTIISKRNELIQTVSAREHGGRLGEISDELQKLPLSLLGQGGLGSLRKDEQAEIVRLQKDGQAALEQQADKQLSLNDILRETISGNERQVALKKSELEFNEKIGKITALEAQLGIQGVTAAQSSARSQHDLELTSINKEFDLRDRELRLQHDIVDAEKELLTPSEQNLRILDLRISAIRDLLQTERFLTDVERQRYQTQLGGLQAERSRAQQNLFQSGPIPFIQQDLQNRSNQHFYNQARERYLKEEAERRAGSRKDIRGPALKNYEDTVFGPLSEANSQSAPTSRISGNADLPSQIGNLINTLQLLGQKVLVA